MPVAVATGALRLSSSVECSVWRGPPVCAGSWRKVAQEESNVSWSGTFGYIMLLGLLIGLLLAGAEHLRKTGGRRGWRWPALTPLVLAAVVFSEGPQGVLGILANGLGGRAIGVPLYAMAGGTPSPGEPPPEAESPAAH